MCFIYCVCNFRCLFCITLATVLYAPSYQQRHFNQRFIVPCNYYFFSYKNNREITPNEENQEQYNKNKKNFCTLILLSSLFLFYDMLYGRYKNFYSTMFHTKIQINRHTSHKFNQISTTHRSFMCTDYILFKISCKYTLTRDLHILHHFYFLWIFCSNGYREDIGNINKKLVLTVI